MLYVAAHHRLRRVRLGVGSLPQDFWGWFLFRRLLAGSVETNYFQRKVNPKLFDPGVSTDTNHAALTQHAQLNSLSGGVGPCCAGKKMSDINMLYLDQERNVVFGKLPNMKVERCGCSWIIRRGSVSVRADLPRKISIWFLKIIGSDWADRLSLKIFHLPNYGWRIPML